MQTTANAARAPWYQRRAVQWTLFALMLLCLLLLLCWKAPYGYGAMDEPFYLTTAQRLAMGDALLCDEWNLSQLSGALLYPAYRLYLALFGSTDGILLAFRYLFIAFKLAVTAGLWLLLRKRYGLGALCACAVYALYTPYNILQFSYNTVAMACLALTGALLLRLELRRPFATMLPAGALFAVAVLCCPHLAFVYAAGLLLCALLGVLRRDRRYGALALAFTAGCALVAAALGAFVLSRASLPEVLANLRQMLSDPEHLGQKATHPYVHVWLLAREQYPAVALFGLPALLGIMTLDGLLTRRLRHRRGLTLEPLYLPLAAALALLALARQLRDVQQTYNYLMVPLMALAPVGYLCLCWREGWRNAAARPMGFWLLAWGYALALNLSSNQLLLAFSSAMALADVATVLVLWQVWPRVSHPRWTLTVAVVTLCCQLGGQCWSVTQHAYWEPSVSAINCEIDRGPLRGVRTISTHAWQYNLALKELDWFRDTQEPGTFVYYSQQPNAYLYLGWPYGTYSAWSGLPERQAAFDAAYWALHPERVPRYLYVEAQYAPNAETLRARAEAAGYAVTELGNGFALVKDE